MVWTSKEPSIRITQHGSFHLDLAANFPRWGHKMALIDGASGKGYSYSEMESTIERLAGNLYHVAGVRKGDVILIFMPNSPEFALLMLALPSIGAILTGCNPQFTSYEVIRQMEDSNAVYLITSSENQKMVPILLQARPQIREVYIVGDNVGEGYIPFSVLLQGGLAPPAVPIDRKEDVALLPYSSGTTGLPKGVMITHYNIAAGVAAMGPRGARFLEEGLETWVVVFPLYHIGGAMQTLYTGLLCGTTMVFFPKYDFETYLAANEKYKATFLGAPPPVYVRIAKDPHVFKYNLSSIRQAFMGGAPTSKETLEEVQRRIPTLKYIKQGYGLTESSGTTHYTRPDDITLGSVGPVVPNVQYKVVDKDTGEELEAGKDGEICVRGDTIMKGYLNRPDATSQTIRNGWLCTGDYGHADKDGHLFIMDRLKELIKFKGFQVPPAELEALLLTHPDVGDAAVVGVPDQEAGELPRAYLVLKAGHTTTADHIKTFVKERAAPYKQLRGGVEFVNEIPKSPSGKLLRRLLRDQIRANTKAKL